MKKNLLSTAFALFLLPATASFAQLQPAPATPAPLHGAPQTLPLVKVPTQRDFEKKSCNDVKEAEKNLDDVYKAVQKKYSYDKIFLGYLEQSQQAWVVYRDAELHSTFPPNYRQSYGSNIEQCECLEATRLNEQRIEELNRWMEGTFQGNICAGTVMKTQAAPPAMPKDDK